MENDIERVYRMTFYDIQRLRSQEGQHWKDSRNVLFDILEEIYDDIFGQYDTSHIGTFAEFRKVDVNGNIGKEPNR